LFTGALDSTPGKPQRRRLIHFYSKNFYETRIKDQVDSRMAALTRLAKNSGSPLPIKIDVIAKVTAEVWEEETPAFKKECEVAMEEEFQQATKAWEASQADSPTRTAEEIAACVTFWRA
jgi:hypothetical protein